MLLLSEFDSRLNSKYESFHSVINVDPGLVHMIDGKEIVDGIGIGDDIHGLHRSSNQGNQREKKRNVASQEADLKVAIGATVLHLVETVEMSEKRKQKIGDEIRSQVVVDQRNPRAN